MDAQRNVIDFKGAHAEYLQAVEESNRNAAPAWQSEVNEIKRVPLENGSSIHSQVGTDEEILLHAYSERDLNDAFDFKTELTDMFRLRRFDVEIESVLCSGLKFALDEMQKDNVTVCGLIVGTMRAMVWSQRHFHSYFDGPVRCYPRRVAHVRAEIDSERTRSRNLDYLEEELKDALLLEKYAAEAA